MTEIIKSLTDLDKNAFEVLDEQSFLVARRVKIYAGTVEATPSGLKTAFRNTTFDVSGVAVELPPIPLTGRNSMIIYNRSTTEILYVGNSNVTADTVNGTTSGWQIEPNSYFPLDITDDIVLYGIFASGTHKIQVLELA